jgi:hypothetical protein
MKAVFKTAVAAFTAAFAAATFCAVLFFYPAAYAAERYSVQLGFDIVESNARPDKAELKSQIDNVSKRESGGRYKYVAGGKFTLAEGYRGSFEVRQKDATLQLSADYAKQDQEYFRINYDANILFPFLESSFRFKNSARIKPGETLITDETALAQGASDTRPYWAVVRVFLLEPSYAEGSYGGIGAALNVKDGYPVITEVQPGSPAERAGLKQGDTIMTVDDVEVLGRNLQDVINLVRGKPYTSVKLKIAQRGEGAALTRTVTVERWILKQ